MKSYPITPVPKPRQTQADKWKIRPCTTRYRAFKDDVRRLGIKIPEKDSHITFYMPIPKSGKDRVGKPHQIVPDVDNLLKALMDAVMKDDAHIWDVRATKVWALEGKITIEVNDGDDKSISRTL